MVESENLIRRQPQSMPQAPEHEVKGAAMPKPAHQKGQQVGDDRNHHTELTDGETVKQRYDWLEHIYLQERGKGDMPSSPEIRDVGRQVRVVEVLGRADAHHVGHADGQVAVAGEVDVDVERIEHGSAQHSTPGAHVREQRVVVSGVGQHERHEKQGLHRTHEDAARSRQQHPRIVAHTGVLHPIVEVVERVDGPRHESGEEEKVVDVREEVLASDGSPVALHPPVDEAEEDVGETEFLDGEEGLLHGVGPELAEPAPHERVLAYGEEDDEQESTSASNHPLGMLYRRSPAP